MLVKQFRLILVFLYIGQVITSCNPGRNLPHMVYLKQGEDSLYTNVRYLEPKIQPGDRLNILVSGLNPASAVPYNQVSSTPSSNVGSSIPGYLVEADGSINFPQLGKIKSVGFTTTELADNLTSTLSKYVKDPVVTVQFLNFRITVLGEVNQPGTLIIPDGKVNLLQALGLSGDMSIYGRRDNVLVIRETNGKRQFGRVDLTSKNIFSSPYYQLQQNDIIYIELNKDKAAMGDQLATRNLGILTSVVSLVLSVAVLVISIVK